MVKRVTEQDNPRTNQIRRERCGTMPAHRRLAQQSAEYRRLRRQLELETREFVARYGFQGLRTGVARIPVVVHVIWNTPAQNISDAQIQSQIDILNADFRRTNSDAGNVPMVFSGVAADVRIEFALAVRDPNCGSTTGITRTNTNIIGFTQYTMPDDRMKSTAQGGMIPGMLTGT